MSGTSPKKGLVFRSDFFNIKTGVPNENPCRSRKRPERRRHAVEAFYCHELTETRLIHAIQAYDPENADRQRPLRFLSIKEFADLMKVSPITVYRMINRGELKAAKIGQQWRIPEDVVEELPNGAHIPATDDQSGPVSIMD